MAEAGGSTTQSGILYQNSITALYLGRLLDTSSRPDNEHVIEVRAEAPTEVDDTVVTFADDHRIYIQAKENLRKGKNTKEWKNLWSDFEKQFHDSRFCYGHDRLQLSIGQSFQWHKNLQGLCECSASSPTLEEWSRRLSKQQGKLLSEIKEILNDVSEQEIKKLLSCIDIEILSREAIERDRLRDWMPRTNRMPDEIFRLLRDRVGGHARLKATFEAGSLRQSLIDESPDIQFDIPHDIKKLQKEIYDCGSVLQCYPSEIANTGIHLTRDVANKITEWLIGDLQPEQNVLMLLDQAGMGKTVLMRSVLLALRERNVDVLAIKADLQLSGVSSLDEIRERLSLTYTLEKSIRQLAQLNRVVILIDQIDALSLSLAHDQRTMDIVFDLITRLRQIPNVSLLISCRVFDRKTDPRLNKIQVGKEFKIPYLKVAEIQKVLGKLQIDYNDLTHATKLLIQTPLHLNLFVRVIEAGTHSIQGIGSLQELYALIWDSIICKRLADGPSISDRIEVINRLTDYMDEKQKTSVPDSLLLTQETKHLEKSTDWLASESILIKGQKEWSFLHQTFFDYCYARHFIESDNDLVCYIRDSRQGIFDRSKLTQILDYLRGSDLPRYIVTLKQLLDSDYLRFHMRDLLLRWFGSISNPTADEWCIAYSRLQDPSSFQQLLPTMYGNLGWFEHTQPLISDWLAYESIQKETLSYIGSFKENAQAQMISILEPLLDGSDEFITSISYILFGIRTGYTEEAISLYEKIIYRSDILQYSTLRMLDSVSHFSPSVGCRLIQHLFEKAFNKHCDKSLIEKDFQNCYFQYKSMFDEFQKSGHHLEATIQIICERVPQEFVQSMWPWAEKIICLWPIYPEGEEWFLPDAFSSNWYDENINFQTKFLRALINALTKLTEENSEQFQQIISGMEQLPYQTPNRIRGQIYSQLPALLHEDGFKFLTSDIRRLNLGSYNREISCQLITSIYPYLTYEQQVQLETLILDHNPIYKSSGLNGLKWRGIQQYRLLSAIPSAYLSTEGEKRLGEWQRKFPDETFDDSKYKVRSGFVGSPIPSDHARKMSNQNWLDAFEKCDQEIQHNDLFKGGARQLATVLRELVKENPNRFYQIFQRTHEDIHVAYIDAFICGFIESNAPPEYTFELFRRHSNKDYRELKRYLSRAIERLALTGYETPEDIVQEIIQWVYGPSGEDEEWWLKDNTHYGPYDSYLNSDRGSAFDALMRIYDNRATNEAQEQKWELIEFISHDPSTAMRVGAIHKMACMIRYDRARSWNLFVLLISEHEILLETEYVYQFLYRSMYQNFFKVQTYIECMMNCDREHVQNMGAELACIASISPGWLENEQAIQNARKLAERAWTGTLVQRQAAAYIYTYNITRASDENIRSFCEARLIELLGDPNKAILDEINNIFYSINEKDFYVFKDLFESIALADSHEPYHKFAEYLWEHGLKDPEWTLEMIEILLGTYSKLEQWSPEIETLIRFILRICTSHTDSDDLIGQAMATFDMIMETYSNIGDKILLEWDRH